MGSGVNITLSGGGRIGLGGVGVDLGNGTAAAAASTLDTLASAGSEVRQIEERIVTRTVKVRPKKKKKKRLKRKKKMSSRADRAAASLIEGVVEQVLRNDIMHTDERARGGASYGYAARSRLRSRKTPTRIGYRKSTRSSRGKGML